MTGDFEKRSRFRLRFASMVLKSDEMGNVWMATHVTAFDVYDKAGERLGTIKTPEGPSNCCWGEGFRGLYITARKSVYQVATKVSGTRTF